MDVSLKSVLQKATKGKGNLEEALSTGAKRKRSVTKDKVNILNSFLIGQLLGNILGSASNSWIFTMIINIIISQVTESVKFDDSLVGKKVKVWWALDKMYVPLLTTLKFISCQLADIYILVCRYYEGVVESFDSKEKKHKVIL